MLFLDWSELKSGGTACRSEACSSRLAERRAPSGDVNPQGLRCAAEKLVVTDEIPAAFLFRDPNDLRSDSGSEKHKSQPQAGACPLSPFSGRGLG